MYKPTLLALTLLASGCAHRSPNAGKVFYNELWSKPEATQEMWAKDSHDCDFEQHQRENYDQAEYQRRYDRAMEYNKQMERDHLPLYWPLADIQQADSSGYWSECMKARMWKMVGQNPIGTWDTGLRKNTHSFKP